MSNVYSYEYVCGAACMNTCWSTLMALNVISMLFQDLPWRYLHTPGQKTIAPLGIYRAMEDNMRPAFPPGTPTAIVSIISQCWNPVRSPR